MSTATPLLLVSVALCGCTSTGGPPPRVAPADEPVPSIQQMARITVYHRPYSLLYPVYAFRLFAPGRVQYIGECSTPLLGTYEAPADTSLFAHAARLLTESGFFRSDTASERAPRGPVVSITVLYADSTYRRVTYPLRSSRVAAQIEQAVATLPFRIVEPAPRPCGYVWGDSITWF